MIANSLFIFLAAVVYGVNAVTCPRCTDPNNWRSCIGTQICGGGEDTCQMTVENADNKHKVAFHCAHSLHCEQHQTPHCDLSVHGHCQFCCDSIDSCTIQMNGFFNSSVSAAVTCPRCTNENDWTSCTATQNCDGGSDMVCQMVVDNKPDHHKVNYHCTHRQTCLQHETQDCDLSVQGHCQLCCDSMSSCAAQRDGVFGPSP